MRGEGYTLRVAAVAALVWLMSLGSPPVGAAVASAPCWPAPVAAPVADAFRAPPCRWCAGNRGIEYATVGAERVSAVAPGRVSFAGSVAGVGYLTVELPAGIARQLDAAMAARASSGGPPSRGVVLGSPEGSADDAEHEPGGVDPGVWRLTYGRVHDLRVRVGAAVSPGDALASADGAFILTLRRGDVYVDPAHFIGGVRGVPRLVPLDALPPRRSPRVRSLCPAIATPIASNVAAPGPARSWHHHPDSA